MSSQLNYKAIMTIVLRKEISMTVVIFLHRKEKPMMKKKIKVIATASAVVIITSLLISPTQYQSPQSQLPLTFALCAIMHSPIGKYPTNRKQAPCGRRNRRNQHLQRGLYRACRCLNTSTTANRKRRNDQHPCPSHTNGHKADCPTSSNIIRTQDG